jgi:hypothetical protein
MIVGEDEREGCGDGAEGQERKELNVESKSS